MTESSNLELLKELSPEKLQSMWDDADDHGDRSKEGYTKGDIYQAISAANVKSHRNLVTAVETVVKDSESSAPVGHTAEFISLDSNLKERRGY